MGLFGSTTRLQSQTVTENTDRRTLAEAGGIAAQQVGGDLVLQSVDDEAFNVASDAIRSVGEVLNIAELGIGAVQQTAAQAVDVVAASKGTQPVNPVFVIVAIGAALYLARGSKLL